MGSDFVNKDSSNIDSSSGEKEKNKKNKKKPKKKKLKNKNNDNEIKDNNDNDGNVDNSEKSDDNNISEDNEEDKNKKKRGRKKKKKEIELSFHVEDELPDPENLDSIALALEMKKYGMKPQNKKRNIEILKSVYNFLKIKELPENLSKKLVSFDIDNNDNTDSENDNKIKSKKQESISTMSELNEEQKKRIIEIIKENKEMYEKILLFKEISLKEIKALINSKGIIVPNHLLSQLLIDSGVVLPGGWNDKR